MPKTKPEKIMLRIDLVENRLKKIKRMIEYGGSVNIIREAWIRVR